MLRNKVKVHVNNEKLLYFLKDMNRSNVFCLHIKEANYIHRKKLLASVS